MKQNFQVTRDLGRRYPEKPTDLGNFKMELLAWDEDVVTNWTKDMNGMSFLPLGVNALPIL
jgi:hypothetical protein